MPGRHSWRGHWTPAAPFKRFVSKTGQRPRVYSFDLAGYGTIQFPERGVYALAGFSEKAFETLKFLEEDKTALLREIDRIEL